MQFSRTVYHLLIMNSLVRSLCPHLSIIIASVAEYDSTIHRITVGTLTADRLTQLQLISATVDVIRINHIKLVYVDHLANKSIVTCSRLLVLPLGIVQRMLQFYGSIDLLNLRHGTVNPDLVAFDHRH